MIYQSNTVKAAIQASAVATAAGISAADWVNHVFVRYGEEDMTGNTSIGRLPVVTIREVSSSYTFEAEPSHNGTRSSEFLVRIYVASFMNRSETAWKALERIRTASLASITATLGLGVTDVRTQPPVVTQCSIYQDITITTETSYDNTYSEGN
jgi:hypothetical protein